MMLDHVSFSSLQFPAGWELPKFQLGQTVLVDGRERFIVGAEHRDSESLNPDDDPDNIGWWFYICVGKEVAGRVIKDVWGKHQDVIQKSVVGAEAVPQCCQHRTTIDSTLQHLPLLV